MQTTIAHSLFEEFVTIKDGLTCYKAGLPGYASNFSRDTLLAGIIATDQHLLENQLLMSYMHQGKEYDAITGEEPGKIHHEYPGVEVHEPYLSTYNACDTTALYLIGLEILGHLNKPGSMSFLQHHREGIESGVAYIERHIQDDIFWEFPPPGAKHFSLLTTYWKDSMVPRASGSAEPDYPVAFGLVQFQVARGLLAAATMLERNDLRAQADRLFRRGIETFMTDQYYCIEQDRTRRLKQISSDELHALAYIPLEYARLLPKKAISRRATGLITKPGIVCAPRAVGTKLPDQYHGYTVWIFEQALIHYGCQKFGLSEIAGAARRCVPYIEHGQERLLVEPGVKLAGNDRQLWSVAAKKYFSNMPSLRNMSWL